MVAAPGAVPRALLRPLRQATGSRARRGDRSPAGPSRRRPRRARPRGQERGRPCRRIDLPAKSKAESRAAWSGDWSAACPRRPRCRGRGPVRAEGDARAGDRPRARRLQHRGLRPDRRQPVPAASQTTRSRPSRSTSTPRRTRTCGASCTQGQPAAAGRRPHRGAGQLLPLRLPARRRGDAPFSVTTEVARVPVEAASTGSCAIGLQRRARSPTASVPAAQPRLPARRLGLDGRPEQAAARQAARSRLLVDEPARAGPRRDRRLRRQLAASCCRRRRATRKATILDALAALEAGGSTNGGAGIQLAYELAARELRQGRRQPRHPRDRRRLQRRRHRASGELRG